MVIYEETPVELICGKTPGYVVTIENSFPEQLTTPERARDLADRAFQTNGHENHFWRPDRERTSRKTLQLAFFLA